MNAARQEEIPVIALVVPSMRGGGAERVILRLAKGFVHVGLEVDLLLAQTTGPYMHEIPAGVNIIDLKATRVSTAGPGIARYLTRRRPTAVLSAMRHVNIIVLLAAKLTKVDTRVILSEHNRLTGVSRQGSRLFARVMRVLMRLFYPHADHIVAVSSGLKEDLVSTLGLHPDSIDVIYNPVNLSEVEWRSLQPTDHPIEKSTGEYLVLAAGRLTEQKDFETLIRAFKKVSLVLPVRLVILGEGPERERLESLLAEEGLTDKVLLPGFESNPFRWMREADLFVLSSRWEGLGLVLIEAMATGTQVVSTNCPSGPSEILENGRWGRLVTLGNVRELADAITQSLMDTDNDRPLVKERAAHFDQNKAVIEYSKLMLGEAWNNQRRKPTAQSDDSAHAE